MAASEGAAAVAAALPATGKDTLYLTTKLFKLKLKQFFYCDSVIMIIGINLILC